MISFRCWYCNKGYSVADSRVGEEIACGCHYRLRVPTKSGGYCRIKTLTDRLVEAVVYGGGGAVLGFGLALVILSRVGAATGGRTGLKISWLILGGLTSFGFLFGLVMGERGIEIIGRWIRDRESR